MKPLNQSGSYECHELARQRANVCFIEPHNSGAWAHPPRKKPRRLGIAMMFITGLMLTALAVGFAHLPKVFALADHTYRVGYVHPDCPTPKC